MVICLIKVLHTRLKISQLIEQMEPSMLVNGIIVDFSAMQQSNPSHHHDFGAEDAIWRDQYRSWKLRVQMLYSWVLLWPDMLISHKPCNHPQMCVLKDKQDFIWNEWVRLGHPTTMILGLEMPWRDQYRSWKLQVQMLFSWVFLPPDMLISHKPCNHPQMGALKDRQDFIWNEWVWHQGPVGCVLSQVLIFCSIS